MKLWGYEFCEDWRIPLSLPMSTSHKTHLSIPSPLKLLTTYLSQLRNIKQPKPTFTLTQYSLPTYLVWGTHFVLFLDIITGYHKNLQIPNTYKMRSTTGASQQKCSNFCNIWKLLFHQMLIIPSSTPASHHTALTYITSLHTVFPTSNTTSKTFIFRSIYNTGR